MVDYGREQKSQARFLHSKGRSKAEMAGTTRIITLTSDMGLQDHYVAVIKAAILCECSNITIVDVTHNIPPFDNHRAAFVLGQAYPEFPEGTVHIIGVNPEIEPNTPHLVVHHGGHYFIGADNGIFSLLFPQGAEEVFELTMKMDENRISFPTKQVFAKVACHLAKGGTPEVLGRRTTEIKQLYAFKPVANGSAIRGAISHVDSYGNLLTNIDREIFTQVGKGRKFRITFSQELRGIENIYGSYGDVPAGERVAFFGDNDMLEIAINKGVKGAGGGADQLLGGKVQDPVMIEFA